MKTQVIVTSWQRPKYLLPTLHSLRQDNIELYVADGGSDEETIKIIREYADDFLVLPGNPGADVSKNEGIRRFVTNPYFIITSDDLLFEKGYSDLIVEQFTKLNSERLVYAMMACSTDHIIYHHQAGFVPTEHGFRIMPVGTCMVSGAIMPTQLFHIIGGFPVYGKSGCGDHAISKVLRDLGYKLGFFEDIVCKHIGVNKAHDYADYTTDFRVDEDEAYPRSIQHRLEDIEGVLDKLQKAGLK